MSKIRSNIVYVGDDSYYRDSLKLYIDNDIVINDDLFHLVRINDLSEVDWKRGFLLLLTMDDLYDYFPNVIDICEPDVYEIDRYVRKIFKNFEYVIIISIEEFDYGHIPFSNIYVEYANKYFDTNEGIRLLIDKLYEEYICRKGYKLSKIKINNINKLRKYIKNKKTDFITTKEIMEELKVNKKWIQRYMKDMNNIYDNIGYNKRKRVWYVVKDNNKI